MSALDHREQPPADLLVRAVRVFDPRENIDATRDVLVRDGVIAELAAEVIDSPQAVIGQQVAAGVVVRMAVLYELLAGRAAPTTAPSTPAPQLA